jgi:hypothetical protein
VAGVRPCGAPGRGIGDLRVPVANRSDPGRGNGPVPGAARLLLNAQGQGTGEAGSGPGGQPADLALRRAEIDQATGMLTEQLGVGIAEAFIRLRAYAYAHDRALSDLARDIVARRLRLRPDPDLRQDGQV